MNEKISKNEVEKDNLFTDLKKLRDEDIYSNEVPNNIIHGPNIDHKVQKNWWQILIAKLYFLVKDKMISEELIEETNEFIKKFSEGDFSRRLTTGEDITEANALIDKILESQNK